MAAIQLKPGRLIEADSSNVPFEHPEHDTGETLGTQVGKPFIEQRSPAASAPSLGVGIEGPDLAHSRLVAAGTDGRKSDWRGILLENRGPPRRIRIGEDRLPPAP